MAWNVLTWLFLLMFCLLLSTPSTLLAAAERNGTNTSSPTVSKTPLSTMSPTSSGIATASDTVTSSDHTSSLSQSRAALETDTPSLSASGSPLTRTSNVSDSRSANISLTAARTSSQTLSSSIGTLSESRSLPATDTVVVKSLTYVIPPTFTLGHTDSLEISHSLSMSQSVSRSSSAATHSGSASVMPTSSVSLTISASLPLTQSLVATQSKTLEGTGSISATVSYSMSVSLPPTTSVPPPTTTPPITPTRTLLTQCPDCVNGVCVTTTAPFLCNCFKSTSQGFWQGGREDGEACLDCLPAYWGPMCLNVCPGGRCSPCSLHGDCSSGVSGNGTCSCYSDPVRGYWTGASCQGCQAGYFGPMCTGVCDCSNDGACFDGISGNGTCLCPYGRAAPDCYECSAGYGGPNCTACPGTTTPCSNNGVCHKTFGNCTCNTGWVGVACDQQCTDCAENPCRNGGIVVSGACQCGAAFRGPACEYHCPLDIRGEICGGKGTCTWSAGRNTSCACDYSTEGYWGGPTCTECAHPHLSLANNCSAPCPFDTSSCPEGYQGPNCTVRCGNAPLSLAVNCSGRGQCSCNGNCYCDENYGGAYCQTACPRSAGLVCGGPLRGVCFDRTGNGTCKCFGNYAGSACQNTCSCADASYGACTNPLDPSACVCRSGRSGVGCDQCAAGWRGSNCSTRCNNGVTSGTSCLCNASYGGIGCNVQCLSSPLGLCSGPAQGVCQEGESGTGTCACLSGFYGPSCNCTLALCQARRPDGSITCDTATGQCICAAGFGGEQCKDCVSDTYWGSACNELCSCQHGDCGRDTGECTCHNSAELGYWTGELCDECVSGYLSPECKLVSSLTPQITSLQVSASSSGRSYVAQKIFYDANDDAIFVSGQLFARFDGSIDATPRNVSKATAFMMTGCANIIGAFMAVNNTRMHTVVNCNPMSNGYQRIDFVSTTTQYPAPLSPLEFTNETTVTTTLTRPTTPVPRFKLTLIATEVLLEDCFLAYYRNGKTTNFGQVNGEAEWREDPKMKYSSNREIQCVIFKSQVTTGGSERILKLACVPIDPPLVPPENEAVPIAPSINRTHLFVAALLRTDSGDGYSGDAQGVVLYYSSEMDGILIGTVTDINICTIHFIHANFSTDVYTRLYRDAQCRQISGIRVKDGWVLVAIRKCETTGCASTRPTVIRFRPVMGNTNPTVHGLEVDALLTTDYVVKLSLDTLTSALVLVCRSSNNYYKILRVLSTDSQFLVIGSQTSSSADQRGVADAMVISDRRVLLVLHKSLSGVALRRYALIEAMSIAPEISDRRGGTVITVSGRGFVSGLGRVQCKIGNFVMNGTVVDSTRMLCTSPIATGTSCTVDTVDVSIYNSIFTVNRLPLRRIDFPKLRTASPDLQKFDSPQVLQVETTRADESVYTKCKYAAVTKHNNGTVVFSGSIVTNGSAYATDGRLLIRCDPPASLLGSTVATLDVALDGTVFSGLDPSELPTIRYLGDPVGLVPNPQNIRLSSAKTIRLPSFTASIVDVSQTAFGTLFEDIVKFFVTPVIPTLSGNTSTTGQIEGVPAVRLAEFLNTNPVISSGVNKGKGIFSEDSETGEGKIVMVNPVQGVVHLIVNLTSVFDAVVYPWSTSFIITVFPGSIQRIVITREPGDTITTDGLVNDVEVQVLDAAGNIVIGTNNVTIGAAVVERFLDGDPADIPKFITDANPTRVNADVEAVVATSGTATFKSLRLSTRGMYSYALRFYIGYIDETMAFADNKASNGLDKVNRSATAESIEMYPSCNLGDVRTIGSYTCETCLEHAECADGSSISVLPGYWRSSAYSSQTFACTPAAACLGGAPTGTCAVGYEGPVCAVCSAGYGKSAVQGECEECAGSVAKVMMFVLLCIGFGGVIGLTVTLTAQSWRRQSVTIVLMQLFVDHMQAIMLIGALELNYPQFFLDVITYCGLFTLQFLDFPVSDCIIREGGNFYSKFFVYSVMALLCFFAAAVAWVVMFLFPNIFRDNSSRRRQLRRVRGWAREVALVAKSMSHQGSKEAMQAMASGGPTRARDGNGKGARLRQTARRTLINLFNPNVIDEEMAIALEGLTDDESDAEVQLYEEQADNRRKGIEASLTSLQYRGGGGVGGIDTPATAVAVGNPNRRTARRKYKDPSVIHKNHSFRLLSGHALQVIMFFTLPTIVSYSLSMFNCTHIADPLLGDQSYMNTDMSISCDDASYESMYTVGIVVAVLYLALAPLIYIMLYWRELRYYHFHVKKRAQTFAFAMMGIKSSQWFWPAIVLLKKGLQAMIVVLLPNPMDAQVFMWLLVVYIVMFVHVRPYLSNRVNYLEMICAMSQLLGLCACYFLDMLDDDIAVSFISVIALLIMLSVACVVLVFSAHHTLEMLYLNFRVHVLGDNLTETQSTDSFHLDALVDYREGRSGDHIPLPEGEDDNRDVVLTYTGEVMADVNAKRAQHARDAAADAAAAADAVSRGDLQGLSIGALKLGNSVSAPVGKNRSGPAPSSPAGAGSNTSPLLGRGSEGPPNSFDVYSSNSGSNGPQYSPPSIHGLQSFGGASNGNMASNSSNPQQSMPETPLMATTSPQHQSVTGSFTGGVSAAGKLDTKPTPAASSRPAVPPALSNSGPNASTATSGGGHGAGSSNWDYGRDNRQFGVNVKALQADDHFNQNYPSRANNHYNNANNSTAFDRVTVATDATSVVSGRGGDPTSLSATVNSLGSPTSMDAGGRGGYGGGDASAVSAPPAFVSLMPESSAQSRRRRGRRGEEDEEEAAPGGTADFGTVSNRIIANVDSEGSVPVFASYSSKLSEAMLAAEQRNVMAHKARLEDAHRQATMNRRGGGGGGGDRELAVGGKKAPGFLGDDAHNTVDYTAYMRRMQRHKQQQQGGGGGHRREQSDSDDEDLYWSQRGR